MAKTRSRHAPRNLVERTPCIDIRALKRNGQIATGETSVMLCLVGEGQTARIRLANLERPVLGGVRTYFCCPACDRQCDLLYMQPNLACRRCHGLAFASENETRANRALRKSIKRRERLGQVAGGVVAPFPCKPKWGRWARYLRIRRQALLEEREHWRTLAVWVALLESGRHRRRIR